MPAYTEVEGALERRSPDEIVRMEPWGPPAVRVRTTATVIDSAQPGALGSPPASAPDAVISVLADGGAQLVNGRITAHADAEGRLRFTHTATGRELLAEKR